MSPSRRRHAALTLLALLLSVEAGIFLVAKPAYAVPAEITAPTGPFGVAVHDYTLDIRSNLIATLIMATLNAVNFFAQSVAYDIADSIAENGIGKKPLFEDKSWGDYLEDTGLNAVGEFLGTIDQHGLLPFKLCDPPNINITLSIALGIVFEDVGKPKPKCEWQTIIANYKDFTVGLDAGAALTATATLFEPGQSELDLIGQTMSRADFARRKAEIAAERARSEGRGFIGVLQPITGRIQTPAMLVEKQATLVFDQSTATYELTWQGAWEAIKQAPGAIGLAALNTFVSHLITKLLFKVFKGLLFQPANTPFCNLGIAGCTGVTDAEFGGSAEQIGATRRANVDLITPPLQQDSRYDVLAEFTTCPDNFRTANNCVMDTQFAAAIAQGPVKGRFLTVREAINQGYLHGDWPLIPNSEAYRARNADPYCFASGYCYSNLVKLRKARILPVGWELAAAKSGAEAVKLSTVVEAFDDCPTNADPNPANHPWCHLIDPNWVLKLPVTQCRLKAFGPTLLDPEAPTRAQVCVDTPSCIAEDGNGNCVEGYGYCAREKSIWRLGGTQCKAPYASCASFNGRTGQNLLALQSTLDYGVCTADNVGCRPYFTQRDAQDATKWGALPGYQKVYLDKGVAACDAKDGGCTKVIDKEGLRRNLVVNSGFEEDVAPNADLFAKYWTFASGSGGETKAETWNNDADYVHTGSRSIKVPSGVLVYQEVSVEPNLTYTVSYYARRKTANQAGKAYLALNVLANTNTQNVTATVPIPAGNTTCAQSGGATSLENAPPAGTDWQRVDCTVTIPPNDIVAGKYPAYLTLALIRTTPTLDVYVDDVQVEEGPVATEYHDSAFDGGTVKTIKVPPDYLLCTGDPEKDNPDCGKYDLICRSDEVGCDRFTPEEGGPDITAVTSLNDACPSECVGYTTFRKEPSNYDVASYPLYFIAGTANQCNASAAGCTEFTNLDTLAAGGEAREYYSYLRPCEKPGASVPTYYTWEGSDTAGYQLKEWHLKAGAPLAGEPAGTTSTQPPATVLGYSPAACTKDVIAAGLNPDCREFFDITGKVSYRLYGKTILITDACRPYRVERPAVDTSATTQAQCTGQKHWAAGDRCIVCEDLGGSWDATSGECVFEGVKDESNACQASENGCRLFTGNAGANVRSVFLDTWENVTGPWSKLNATDTHATSTESTTVGGHSLRSVLGPGKTLSYALRRLRADTEAIEKGGLYTLSFWAKGPNVKLGLIFIEDATLDQTPIQFLPVNPEDRLTGEWKRYSVGPFVMDFGHAEAKGATNPDGDLVLVINPDITPGLPWYLDNVELRKVGNAVSLIEGSWKTPQVCDQTASGLLLPQAQLGCAAYEDRNGETRALKSFDRLCRASAVGCRAFVDTRGNDFTGFEYWNALAVNTTQVTTQAYGQPPKTYSVTSKVLTPTPGKAEGVDVCTIATQNASCKFHATSTKPPVAVSGGYVSCLGENGLPCYIDDTYICTPQGGTECTGHPTDLVTIPPDRTVYLVDDPAKECDAAEAGCTEVGTPTAAVCTLGGAAQTACVPAPGASTCACDIAVEVCNTTPLNQVVCKAQQQFACDVPAGKTTCSYALPRKEPYPQMTFASKYLILDPAQYDSQVCTSPAIGCESWKSANRNAPTVSYFKSPDGRECEYKEGVKIGDVTYAGYFKKGTDAPCDPSFLIGGNYYGIRKTADVNYFGYAGSCPADQAGCTEFVDPTDYTVETDQNGYRAEPRRYYYIKDSKIDDASCNGQASLKDGCVLLDDTSDPAIRYSAVGTYDDSETQQFKPVPAKPGVCTYTLGCVNGLPYQKVSGSLGSGWISPYFSDPQDYLSQPIWWPFASKGLTKKILGAELLYNPVFTGAEFQGFCSLASTLTGAPATFPFFFAGRGCSTNDDCRGNGIPDGSYCVQPNPKTCATSADCDLVPGGGGARYDCQPNAVCTQASREFRPTAPANSVIKVNRDRICGQWFACRSSTPVWDARLNKFREVCDDMGLCQESAIADATTPSVENSLCKDWVDKGQGAGADPDAERILSEDLYRKRDVSFTGLDYAGYSIPHEFPLHTLSQAKILSVCDQPGLPTLCKSAADCDAKPTGGQYDCVSQYSLGKNVGFCYAADGGGCISDTACAAVGLTDPAACYQAYGAFFGYAPSQAGSLYKACEGKTVGEELDTCIGDIVKTFGDGTCWQHQCFQSVFGNPAPDKLDLPQPLAFDPAGFSATLGAQCRAYPEASSPVPNDVVLAWDGNDLPASVKQGFQSANVCANGQDCECSYQKITYANGDVSYGSKSSVFSGLGVCDGGAFDGALCFPAVDKNHKREGFFLTCNEETVTPPAQPDGTCSPIKRQDYVQGLDGYCLEQDEATPIYGRELSGQGNRACVTWLPVDRLSGQPDLYNQYRSATYEIADSYACLVPQMYKAVKSYGYSGGTDKLFAFDDTTKEKMWVGCAWTSSQSYNHDFFPVGPDKGSYSDSLSADPTSNASPFSFGKDAGTDPFLACPPSTGFIVMRKNPGQQRWTEDGDDSAQEGDDEDCTHFTDDCETDEMSGPFRFSVKGENICGDGLGWSAPYPDPRSNSDFPGDDFFSCIGDCTGVTYQYDHFLRYPYICVPWGAVHASDAFGLKGKECKLQDVKDVGGSFGYWPHGPCKAGEAGATAWDITKTPGSGVFKDYANSSPAYCDRDQYVPKFDPTKWPAGSPPKQAGLVSGDATPIFLIYDDAKFDDTLAKMSDCWKLDAPVTETIAEPYNGAYGKALVFGTDNVNVANLLDSFGGTCQTTGNPTWQDAGRETMTQCGVPTGYWLGCSVLAQVTKAGGNETNKAFTDRTGGSDHATPPPSAIAATPLTMSALVGGIGPKNNYEFTTSVQPWGQGNGINPASPPAAAANPGRKLPFLLTQCVKSSPTADDPVPPADTLPDLDLTCPDGTSLFDNGTLRPFVFINGGGGGAAPKICDADGKGCWSYWGDAPAPYTYAADRGQSLFAKFYDLLGWVFHPGSFGYQPLPGYVKEVLEPNNTTYSTITNTSSVSAWNKIKNDSDYSQLLLDRSLDSAVAKAPIVRALSFCEGAKCLEKEGAQAFTVNGVDTGEVAGGGGWLRATVKFFGAAGPDGADQDNMDPIRAVAVIWNVGKDDSSRPGNISDNHSAISPGYYKNHRGYQIVGGQKVSKCDNTTFGTSPAACDDSAPFTFVHNYTCAKTSPHCEDDVDKCWDAGRGACVYVPAVYVLNNWGICAGSCGDSTSPVGGLCSTNNQSSAYVSDTSPMFTAKNQVTNGKDECSLNLDQNEAGREPWVRFGGKVIVTP